MKFDLFHSLARIDSVYPRRSNQQTFRDFFQQVDLADQLEFDTLWLAESHFSSECQKNNPKAVIPNFSGEVGLNCDSFQLIQLLMEKSKKLNFGTAIHNIVGGNGGPLASADRLSSLVFLNSLRSDPRHLHIGFAAGRFPYINRPFGITPRTDFEKENWDAYARFIFLEATEIFLRLSQGEILSSEDIDVSEYRVLDRPYERRWTFEPLRIMPDNDAKALSYLRFVVGSHDPRAQELAMKLSDVDVFNLSYTPPDKIDQLHNTLSELCKTYHRSTWRRARLPRTVLVFIDNDHARAQKMAEACFDTYIEAMRGTVVLPPKSVLMERALVGSPSAIRDQLDNSQSHGFTPDERLMLWFEFNQNDSLAICKQMELFAREFF